MVDEVSHQKADVFPVRPRRGLATRSDIGFFCGRRIDEQVVEALRSRQEHIEHVAQVIVAGVCRSVPRITVVKSGPIREVVEEVMGTIWARFSTSPRTNQGEGCGYPFCSQKKENIDTVRIMPQERGQIGAVEQAVDAPTRQTQVEKAEVVRRVPRVCTSERIVEQTVEFLVSCQEQTQHLVRPQAYVNRRR